jgi:hypothetical protein
MSLKGKASLRDRIEGIYWKGIPGQADGPQPQIRGLQRGHRRLPERASKATTTCGAMTKPTGIGRGGRRTGGRPKGSLNRLPTLAEVRTVLAGPGSTSRPSAIDRSFRTAYCARGARWSLPRKLEPPIMASTPSGNLENVG